MTSAYVVGADAASVNPETGRPTGVWHAVDVVTHEVMCGEQGLAVFEDLVWDATHTAGLCSRCLRKVAGW